MSRVAIELRAISVRLEAPLPTAHGEIRERQGFEVTALDAGGLRGQGEAAPLEAFGTESLASCEAALRAARIGFDEVILLSPDAIDRALDGVPALATAPSARCGIELALLDLGARRAGLPLSRWLAAGAAESVRCSALSIAGRAPRGFDTVKIKVGLGDLASDVARVAAAREAAGPGVRIRLDANGAWTPDRADAALRSLARFEPELCEQPLPRGAPVEAWRALRSAGVPLAADESVADEAETDALLAARAVDVLVLKPQVIGGHGRALRLATRAAAAGVPSIATTSLEGVVGRAGAAHLAAAIGGPFAHGLATGDLLATDTAADPLAPRRGRISLAAAAGLGVDAIECPVSRWARETPAAEALRAGDASITYAELDARVRRAVAALRELGVQRGDRVGLLADAGADAAVLVHATARIGAPLVLLNARLTAEELRPLVEQSEPAVAFADRDLLSRLDGARDLAGISAGSVEADTTERPLLRLRDVQTVLFTSGTTGRAKGAQLTVGAHLASARAAERLFALDGATRWLCVLPLFHVGGLAIVQRCALCGGSAVLQPRFDAEASARALLEGGVTHASLVASTLQRMLDALDGRRPDKLEAVMAGGGPVPQALLRRASAAGVPVLQTYGLTEAGSHATCERPGDADGATAGPPVPGMEIRISSGEIEVRGPSNMVGYLGDTFITEGAWLQTGDLGTLDARGRLIVHARRTDLIVSGGENVYPAEVEAALLSHPAVADAAVGARPDERWGQTVAAAIVLRPGCDDTTVEAFLRARLAGFKLPRVYLRVAAIPRNPAGKVDRAALAALLTR